MSTEFPVSRTKIVIPTLRPEILHRARLLANFDELLDRKLILVTAPAGYGKTALLVDFAHQSEMPVCWFSLDALDQDPTRFCTYLIAALEVRFPKFGSRSRAALRSLVNLEQDAERMLATMVNEIDSLIDQHFALVVDDYQLIDSFADVRNLFSRFIYLTGENCHIILASRRLPNLPDFTSMVVKQQVGGFDLEQLAFRADEIRELFKKNYSLRLSEDALEELMLQTEGWITGLILSAYDPTQAIPDMTNAARIAGVDMSGYFDQQILAPQAPEMRNFLMESSLLREFNASLCDAVFGDGDWKKLIKMVRHNNLFALPVGPGGKWLRYHPLFRDFLQHRLEEEDPERVKDILLRLAEAYKKGNEWEKAHAIYQKLGNQARLADMLEAAGRPMLLSEHLFTLRTWLDELPPALLQERPILLSYMATVLSTLGQADRALAILDKVIPIFRKNNDTPGLAFAFVTRAAASRLVGDYASSLHDADEALQLKDDNPDSQFIYAEAKRFKAISLHDLGRIAEAIQLQEEALQQYQFLGDSQRATWVQMELGMTYRSSGNYPAALSAYEKVLAEWKRNSNLPSQADTLNSLGVLYHNLGEYEKAVRAFEGGLDSARTSHAVWQEAFLLASLGDLFTDLDEYESANQAYTDSAEAAQSIEFTHLKNYLSLAQARLARLSNQSEKAGHYLGKIEEPVRKSGSNYDGGFFHFERGCLRLMTGELEQASVDLEQALNYFRFGGYIAEAAWSQIWLAAAELNSGKTSMARTRLLEVLGVEPSNPIYHSRALAIRRALPWLREPQQEDGIALILAPWLGRIKKIEAQLPAQRKRLRKILTSVSMQKSHLSIHAFGRTQVRVKGELVSSAQWKTATARELFFYILAAPRPLTKEEIGDTLWPEFGPEQLKLAFKNNLYRLRHALGEKVILYEDNLYRFNHFTDYEYDVEDFIAHLAQAKQAVEIKEKILHLRAATLLRNGHYLQDLDGTWVLPERQRLEKAWMDGMKELAEAERRAGDLQAAVQTCQEALKVDNCREDLHCLAMQLHFERGDRLAVIWQYKECCKALSSELDIEPSEMTKALYRRLTA
jgi:LuxR family transcriptional regulator, maltose regulon positive regulatory protein